MSVTVVNGVVQVTVEPTGTVVVTVNHGPTGAKGDAGIQGVQGIRGEAGEQGVQGVPGAKGDAGTQGVNGVGVPVGGTTGQVLAKTTGTDFDTEWVDQTGGPGGGGTVTAADVGLGNVTNTSDSDKPVSTAQQAALDLKMDSASIGAVSGVAPLGSDQKVPAAYLPSYVDDVLEYANITTFPGTGEIGKIYTALDTSKIYRWSGSVYVEISAAPGSTDAVVEGYTNLYFTTARVLAAILSGLSTATGTVVTAADSLLVAIGKLQAQISGKEPAITAGTTAQYLRGDKSLATFATDALAAAPAETETTTGATINGATGKTTPVDTDYIGVMDSAALNILKKLSWANIKATLKTYFDTLYAPISASLFDALSALTAAEISITGAASLTIGRSHLCSGTSINYEITLPAVSGNTGKLLGVRMDAGLTKLVSITTGADAVTKTGTVTGGTGLNAAGTGTISTSGSSTTVTGSGTAFTTQLRVGDTIYTANNNARVVAIASNTSLTIDSAQTVASSSFTYTQTGILGSGTQLSTDYIVGNGITIGGVTRQVTYVLSATVIAVDIPFLVAPAASAHGVTTTTIDGQYNRVMWATEAATLLCDGTNWTKTAGKSIPMSAGLYLAGVQLTSASTMTKILLDTAKITPSVASMHLISTNEIVPPRTSMYMLVVVTQYGGTNSTATRLIGRARTGSSVVGWSGSGYSPGAVAGYGTARNDGDILTRGAPIHAEAYFDAGTYTTNSLVAGSTATLMSLKEIPQW